MPWRITGQMIESCSCNMLCPCWFGVQELMLMDQGWCAGALAVVVEQGNSDGVDLGGRTVILGFDFPGPTLFDGNATARLYVDEGANADQRRELEGIFQGRKGGPMEGLSDLITRWLPTQGARIDFDEQGDTITITVGEFGQLISRLMRDPKGRVMTLRGGGFVADYNMEALELAPSSTRWSDPDLRRVETKSGGRGRLTWSA
jgi:hypothetical protein